MKRAIPIKVKKTRESKMSRSEGDGFARVCEAVRAKGRILHNLDRLHELWLIVIANSEESASATSDNLLFLSALVQSTETLQSSKVIL